MTAFVEHRCWKCDVVYGMTRTLDARRRADGGEFFCPNGHGAVIRETDADKLRRERDRLKQDNARLEEVAREDRNRADAAERRTSAAKGQITKLKKRVAGGACPCCNRSFSNLQRHMATKHPNYVERPVLAIVAKQKEAGG